MTQNIWGAEIAPQEPRTPRGHRTDLIIFGVVLTLIVVGAVLFFVLNSAAGAAGDCGGG